MRAAAVCWPLETQQRDSPPLLPWLTPHTYVYVLAQCAISTQHERGIYMYMYTTCIWYMPIVGDLRQSSIAFRLCMSVVQPMIYTHNNYMYISTYVYICTCIYTIIYTKRWPCRAQPLHSPSQHPTFSPPAALSAEGG